MGKKKGTKKKIAKKKVGKKKKKAAAKKPTKKRRKAKAKPISKRAARSRVWRGKLGKSKGGLTKAALTKNKHGKIVSRKASARAGKNKWIAAVVKARKELKLRASSPARRAPLSTKRLARTTGSRQVPVEIAANYSLHHYMPFLTVFP